MQPEQFTPSYDQAARVDATTFSDSDQIDLHASSLAQIAAAREAIVQATKPEQLPELPFIHELRKNDREILRFRAEYDEHTFNLNVDDIDADRETPAFS